jgi:hypothetical protein
MANKTKLLLVVLLLVILVRGMDTRLVEEAELKVVQEGYIRAVGGELSYLNMNLSVPSNTDYQTSLTDRPITKVDAVNSVVNIESSKPSNPFDYKVTSSVSVKARKTVYLPASYQLDYTQLYYTQPTMRVQSDDAGIRELARNITANSSDDFERISKLALWVNKQIEYDSSMAGALKDAKWILNNKRGVCSEYSTLFIALARSIGIPARFVDGVAYDDEKNEWVGHSWVEVYIGMWVPVDPTWNPPEVGYLDAMHLEISKLLDNETLDNVYAYTSQNARLEWSKADGSKAAGVAIISFKEDEKNANYDLEGAASDTGFGMKTLVFAAVSSDDYRVVSLNLTSCILTTTYYTGPIFNIEDAEKNIILRPHESKVVSWVVTPRAGLESSYEYTCPLVINSDYFDAKEVVIRVISDTESINFNGFTEKNELQLGENQTIYVDVGVARTYTGNLYLTSDDSFYSQPITRSGRYSFSLQPKRIGLNRAYLATSLGGVKELQFQVSESGGINVEVNAPQFVPIGSGAEIHVNLASNETNRSVRITASAGAYKEAKQISLTGNKTLEFLFSFNDSKVQNITITIESGAFMREVVEPITIYKIPTLSFTKKLSNAGNGSVRADLIFSGIEDAKDVVLSIDGQQASLTLSGVASVILTPGMHAVRVDYSDMGGTRHSYTANLEIPAGGDIEKNESAVLRYISAVVTVLPAVLYFGSVFILVVAVLILKKTEKKSQ